MSNLEAPKVLVMYRGKRLAAVDEKDSDQGDQEEDQEEGKDGDEDD